MFYLITLITKPEYIFTILKIKDIFYNLFFIKKYLNEMCEIAIIANIKNIKILTINSFLKNFFCL